MNVGTIKSALFESVINYRKECVSLDAPPFVHVTNTT